MFCYFRPSSTLVLIHVPSYRLFTESHDVLIFDNTIFLLALAIADKAIYGIPILEDLWELRIPCRANEFPFRWSLNIVDLPLLRNASINRVSTKPLSKTIFERIIRSTFILSSYLGTATIHALRRCPAFCPFCLGNEKLSASKRRISFIKDAIVWNYLRLYLGAYKWPRACPYPQYKSYFKDETLFLYYLSDIYYLSQPGYPTRIYAKSSEVSIMNISWVINETPKKRKRQDLADQLILLKSRALEPAMIEGCSTGVAILNKAREALPAQPLYVDCAYTTANIIPQKATKSISLKALIRLRLNGPKSLILPKRKGIRKEKPATKLRLTILKIVGSRVSKAKGL